MKKRATFTSSWFKKSCIVLIITCELHTHKYSMNTTCVMHFAKFEKKVHYWPSSTKPSQSYYLFIFTFRNWFHVNKSIHFNFCEIFLTIFIQMERMRFSPINHAKCNKLNLFFIYFFNFTNSFQFIIILYNINFFFF